MFNAFCKAGVAAALFVVTGLAAAAPIAFVPGNDMAGTVYSTGTNNGWADGRGIGFSVSSTQTVSGVGLYQDLTGVGVHYGLYEISAPTGVFARLATLASGGSTVTTNGLAWIDYAIVPVSLVAGKNYLLEFSFDGVSNQDFFYNNANVAWTSGAFTGLDGTLSDDYYNYIVGAFRVDADAAGAADVPEPASLALVGIGMAALGLRRRRRSKNSTLAA